MSPSCRISGIKLELLITLPIFVTIQNAKPAGHLILDADFNYYGSISRYVVAQSELLLCLGGHCGNDWALQTLCFDPGFLCGIQS